MIVVDPLAGSRDWAEQNLGIPVRTFAELDPAISSTRFDAALAIGVISNWGPNHASTFHALVDAGVRRILCEKPMAHPPQAAWDIARRAERDDVRVTFGMYLRYAGLPSFLLSQLDEHGGGAPVMLAVHGGAQWLVTNGIHFLDLAYAVFGELPWSVWAEAVDDRINPCSRTLGFWGARQCGRSLLVGRRLSRFRTLLASAAPCMSTAQRTAST